MKQIDDVAARLRTDYVDLYQCHRYDSTTPLEETMEALTEVVRAGKARHIGFSEWNAAQIQARSTSAASRSSSPRSRSTRCSGASRSDEVIPLCAANGISQIVWSPLAQGALTGKYKPGRAAAEARARRASR